MLLDTIQRLSRDRQEDQQQIIKLTTDREEDQQQIIKLTTDIEKDQQQIIKLTTDREEDRQQIIKLTTDRQEDRQQIIKLTTDREEDQQQIIKLTTDIEKDQQQIIKLTTDREEDRQQIIKLTTDREEDQQQIIKLTTDREEDRQQIIKLTTDRLEDRQQMKEQAKQITSLQSELTNKYNQLNELQIEINSIYDRVESQASVIQVNAQKVAQIESKLDNKDSKADGEQQRDQTTRIEKIEKSLDDQSVEIKHLKTFADRASKLHKTLSNPAVNDKFDSCMHVTGERVMEESEKKWYDLVDAVNEEDDDDDDCFYLETLNDAIKEYSESFVFPKDWEAKYDKLIFDLNEGDILKGVIKLPCYQQEYISLKTFIDIDEFNKELSIQNKWFHISSYVASAIDVDNSCTNFILFYTDKIEDCCLLHVNEEDKEVKVTVDGTKFELEDGFLYDEDSFIIIKLVKFDLMNSFLDDAGLDEV
ncbi:putative leucine-rich repeat-containing protein DDB_G0290503 [Clytia hemisphaerica]